MRPLASISFRAKVTLVGMVTTACALALTGIIISAYQWRSGRQAFIERARTEADILSHSLAPAIEFRDLDPDAVTTALQHLAADPVVLSAIVSVDGEDIAEYRAKGADRAETPIECAVGAIAFEGQRMLLRAAVVDGADTIGQIRIRYDTAPLRSTLAASLAITVGVVAGALVLVFLLGARLQRLVMRPVTELVETTSRITDSRDYTIRAAKHANDELGALTDAFNDMLGQIEMRDEELRRSHDELEERVRLRTHDLEKAKDAAETAARAKSDFLANMSHEIRTPMTAILGYSDLLADDQQGAEERHDCVETIRRNGRHLLSIINDILDISKLESGRMSVETIAASPRRVALDVLDLMRVRADVAGLDLAIRWESDLPREVETDPTRLRQILLNLVGNAVKFTEAGSVTLAVAYAPPTADTPSRAGRLRFDVIDTGIGISEDAIRRLFAAFSQADSSTTRRFGGTGLGLAISQRLAQLLGGEITVASRLGEGATFTLSIDAGVAADVEFDTRAALDGPMERDEPIGHDVREAAAAAAGAEPPSPEADAGAAHKDDACRVLLAEDGPDNQRLIMFHLRRMGCEATLAENGQEAVDLFLSARERDEPFHVVLCDMQMPVKDGYTAARELRELGWTGPIIALTAHAMEGDRERCLAAGCDDYMTKPVDWGALRERLLNTPGTLGDARPARHDAAA